MELDGSAKTNSIKCFEHFVLENLFEYFAYSSFVGSGQVCEIN